MPNEISLPIQSRAAAVMPQSVRDDDRSVELVFTTGAMVRRWDWMEGEYEEELLVTPEAMRMQRLNSGAPLLADHAVYDLERVHGVVEKAWIENGEGRCRVRFAKDEKSETIWQKVRDGIIRNVSVGYLVHGYQEFVEGTRRVLRAIDWEPMEVSLVAVGADAAAGVRSAAVKTNCAIHRSQPTKKRGSNMSDENKDTPAPAEAAAAAPAAPAADAPAAEKPADEPEAAAAPAAPSAEARAVEIMEMCELAGVDLKRAADLVRSNKTTAEVRSALLAQRAKSTAGEISTHVTPPAEKKTGGLSERMAQKFSSKKK